MTPRDVTPERLAQLRRDNEAFGDKLQEIPLDTCGAKKPHGLIRVFRSKHFLVQVYRIDHGMVRLSINRTDINGKRWSEGVTWEELQRIKRECGYGQCDAIEIFPADDDIVNVSNMRHLWVYKGFKLPFAWRKT